MIRAHLVGGSSPQRVVGVIEYVGDGTVWVLCAPDTVGVLVRTDDIILTEHPTMREARAASHRVKVGLGGCAVCGSSAVMRRDKFALCVAHVAVCLTHLADPCPICEVSS